MKSITDRNLMRSAMAPMISAGVMAAKVIWKTTKVSSGMTTPAEKVADGRIRRHAGEEQLVETADIGAAAVAAEGERVAVDDPEQRDDREAGEHLHQHRQHVLGAHQAAVEEGKAGDGHQRCTRMVETSIQVGVALVRHGCCGAGAAASAAAAAASCAKAATVPDRAEHQRARKRGAGRRLQT